MVGAPLSASTAAALAAASSLFEALTRHRDLKTKTQTSHKMPNETIIIGI